MRNRIRRATVMAMAVAALCGVHDAAADPALLRFAYTAPLSSLTYVEWWGPWTEKVNTEGKGILHIQAYGVNQLANTENVYDRLLNNVFELGYGLQGQIGGVFPASAVATLPFVADEATSASEALWNLYANGLIAPEYQNVHVIALNVYSQTILHLKKPVTRLEDMKGLRIATGEKTNADSVQALGAAPITLKGTEYYPSVQRGVVDGIAARWSGVIQYKVQEVTSYHLEVPLGGGTGFMFMNKAAYERLSSDARRIIDANSGVASSIGFGKALDHITHVQRAEVEALHGHTIAHLDPSEAGRWRKILEPIVTQWAAETPNGTELLKAYRAEIDRIKARTKNH